MFEEQEIWKDIKGYEGLYQVSNLGRIKRLPKEIYNNGLFSKTKKYICKEKILKPSTISKGYLGIVLTKNKKRKPFKIHRLVAQAFIPNPKNLPQINHKDENKINNCVSNLEWCDNYYNSHYGTKIERQCKRVYQYDLNGKLLNEYKSTVEAAKKIKGKQPIISACCLHKCKKAYGYKWEYMEVE